MISQRDFGRLEGKVDEVLNRLAAVEKQEPRIRKLEVRQYWLSLTGAGVGSVFSLWVRQKLGV